MRVAGVRTGARVGTGRSMHGESCNSCGFMGKHRARRPASPRHACCATGHGGLPFVEAEKARSARRWDPRVNGADIYVERVTKVGMGSARPLAVRGVVSAGGREAHLPLERGRQVRRQYGGAGPV
jgi:hypothetical protein